LLDLREQLLLELGGRLGPGRKRECDGGGEDNENAHRSTLLASLISITRGNAQAMFASDPDVRYVTRMLRVMAGLLLLVSTAHADDALAPGGTLDASNAAAADGLLPPEVLAHYKAGDYKSTIGAWSAGAPWEEGFEAASKTNVGRLDVNDRGTIVDTATGAPATGIYGIPFRIEAADPKAGVKVMWNAYYALWRVGGTHDLLSIVWAGAKSKQREAVLESHLLFYEGVPPARRPKENALNLA